MVSRSPPTSSRFVAEKNDPFQAMVDTVFQHGSERHKEH
jgi:hypothetical protein